MYTVHTRWWNAKPVIIYSCVHYKSDDGMPGQTSFDIVCCSMYIMRMPCRHHPIMCAVPGLWWHATLDVIWMYVLYNGYALLPHPISSDCMCGPEPWLHATPDVVRLCVMSKGNDSMHCSTWSVRVCCSRAMITCHF